MEQEGGKMNAKDKEATDKLNKWLSDIGLSEECNKDYCNIETKEDGELKELIKEQHRNEWGGNVLNNILIFFLGSIFGTLVALMVFAMFHLNDDDWHIINNLI